MHRPARGGAAWVVSAPFSLAVAWLHCPARLVARSFARLGRRQGRLGRLPFNAIPAGLPLRGNCQKDWLARASALRASAPCAANPFGSSALRLRSNWRARGSSAFGVFAILRSPIWLRLRADASSSCMQRLFSHPARNPQQVGGYAPFPSFSRSVSTDYRLLT